MKAKLTMVLAITCTMLTACDGNRVQVMVQERKITDLETRVSELDGKVTELMKILKDSVEVQSKLVASTRMSFEAIATNYDQLHATLQDYTNQVLQIVAMPTAQPKPNKFLAPLSSPAAIPASARNTRNGESEPFGIPSSVFKQIKDDAVTKWPRDYEMQAYEIKTQVEAYRRVNH